MALLGGNSFLGGLVPGISLPLGNRASISTLLTLVNNELITMGYLPVGAPLRFGPSPKAVKTVPPEVYWVPRSGKGGPPTPAMSRAAQIALQTAGGTIPRMLSSRSVLVEAHIWAGGNASSDDYSKSEALLEAVNSAIHHQCQGSYEYLGDEYVAKGTESANLGHKIVARFYITVPLIELPAVAPVTAPQSVQTQPAQLTIQEGPIPPGGTTTTA